MSLFRTVVISVSVVSMGMNETIGRVALIDLKIRIARNASLIHGVVIVRGPFIECRRRANEAAPNRGRRLIGERRRRAIGRTMLFAWMARTEKTGGG